MFGACFYLLFYYSSFLWFLSCASGEYVSLSGIEGGLPAISEKSSPYFQHFFAHCIVMGDHSLVGIICASRCQSTGPALVGTLRQSQTLHVSCQHGEHVIGSVVFGFPIPSST